MSTRRKPTRKRKTAKPSHLNYTYSDMPKSPDDSDETIARLHDAACKLCGIPTDGYELTTRDMMNLQKIMGYDCTYSRLQYQMREGYIAAPEQTAPDGRAYLWKRKDVLAVSRSMENTRSYVPGSQIHNSKLIPPERKKHAQMLESERVLIQGFNALDTPTLLDTLVVSSSMDVREKIVMVLLSRLDG